MGRESDKVESKRYELVIRGGGGEGKVEEFARVIRRVNSLRYGPYNRDTRKHINESENQQSATLVFRHGERYANCSDGWERTKREEM